MSVREKTTRQTAFTQGNKWCFPSSNKAHGATPKKLLKIIEKMLLMSEKEIGEFLAEPSIPFVAMQFARYITNGNLLEASEVYSVLKSTINSDGRKKETGKKEETRGRED